MSHKYGSRLLKHTTQGADVLTPLWVRLLAQLVVFLLSKNSEQGEEQTDNKDAEMVVIPPDRQSVVREKTLAMIPDHLKWNTSSCWHSTLSPMVQKQYEAIPHRHKRAKLHSRRQKGLSSFHCVLSAPSVCLYEMQMITKKAFWSLILLYHKTRCILTHYVEHMCQTHGPGAKSGPWWI